jgi:hypothetical protein
MPFTVNQPAGIAGSNVPVSLLSDLQILTPHSYPDFIQKYGNENYSWLLEAIGLKEKINGQTFFHFEPYGKLHSSIKNNALVTPSGAGDSVTVTLASTDYFNSGTESPIRVGEVVRIDSSGIEGKITAVDKSTAYAHTATIQPLQSSQYFASAGGSNTLLANEILLFRGDTEAGENSTQIDSLTNLTQRYTNTTTEIRDDWTITDRGMIEEVYFEYDGKPFYKYKGIDESTRRFINNREFKLMTGDIANNLSNGSTGTQGLIPCVVANGQNTQYTAGSLNIAKIHEITRGLDFYGGAAEYHWLSDTYQYQELIDNLFASYSSGAIIWAYAGGSEDIAVSYGFKSLYIDGYNFHFKKYGMFNSERVYGRASANGSLFRNYGLLIPMKQWTDPIQKTQIPTLRVVYNAPEGSPEITVAETGLFARIPTNNTAQLCVTQLAYCGMRVFAANQYMILST